jgi:branched-chain amino acid aminotransferase
VLAAMEARENGWDDSILMNEKGNVCEALSSNLFIVSNDVFFTPPLSSGCVDGVMRKTVMEILRQQGAKVEETDLKPTDLWQADEIFLTNASKGIQSIVSLQGRERLPIHRAETLVQQLNNIVFQTG